MAPLCGMCASHVPCRSNSYFAPRIIVEFDMAARSTYARHRLLLRLYIVFHARGPGLASRLDGLSRLGHATRSPRPAEVVTGLPFGLPRGRVGHPQGFCGVLHERCYIH